MNELNLNDEKTKFLKTPSIKPELITNIILALIYFFALAFFFPVGNKILFAALIIGEIYHIWQVATFIYTIWETEYKAPFDNKIAPPVDVFITVAGEPVELVEKTLFAATKMKYPNFDIYILNDGLVAKKDNWRDIEMLALKYHARCITRTVPGGAKAGNINNALALTKNPLVAIFDADHIPHEDFLSKTVPYFIDPKLGFVQTPQFYRNYEENYLTRGSWEQQELFFGPICKGKNRLNSATMCGTNMLISREGLLSVGGMCTESIAEDFVTGLFMHAKGYNSVYVPEVLAEGLATEDLLSYSKQQFRWARGALDVLFRYNPIFMKGLTWKQRIQYISSASFYLSGLIVILDALLPVIYFYTGLVPVESSSMLLAAIFLPYFFFNLYCLILSSNSTFTFQSLGFSMGSFNIHIKALVSAITFRKTSFNITEKYKQEGFFISLVTWHLAYIGLSVVGIFVALAREGFSASLINNIAWSLVNISVFVPFIKAALPSKFLMPESNKKIMDVVMPKSQHV